MSDIQHRPIPPPRAPKNCKPPLPKRPDRIPTQTGGVRVTPQTPSRDGASDTFELAEVPKTSDKSIPSTKKLEPIVESPDFGNAIAPLRAQRLTPHDIPAPPPVPQKPRRLLSCSSGVSKSESPDSIPHRCFPQTENTGANNLHLTPNRNGGQQLIQDLNLDERSIVCCSLTPPPKPLRSSISPSNDSLSSSNSLPSPVAARCASPLSSLCSVRSDILADPSNEQPLDCLHRGDLSSPPFSPTFAERYPPSLAGNAFSLSSNNQSQSDSLALSAPGTRYCSASSPSSDEPPGSILDAVVRHASSSINVYPDLKAVDGTTCSFNLIDFTSEAKIPLSRENGRADDTAAVHEGVECSCSDPIAVKSQYANLPLVHELGGASPGKSPPPFGFMPHILQAAPEKKRQSPGLEIGPNGGIWNPGYIGLEDYRKLVEASGNYIPVKRRSRYAEVAALSTTEKCEAGDSHMDNVASGLEGSNKEETADGEAICFSGYVHLMFNKKDRGRLWAVLRSNRLTFHQSEDEVDDALHGPYEMGAVTFVGRSPHSRSVINLCLKDNALCLHWNHLKLTADEHNTDHWVLLLAKCFMPKDETLAYSVRNVDAAGRVWIRQGATCPWSKGWMHLDKRTLFYVLDNCAMLFELDVRKFIAMKTEVAKVDWCASVAGSQKGPFLLTQDGSSLYVQAECDSITAFWAEVISSEMERVGVKLEDYKLTADDVPIIVDKCIKFISTYGLYQPGLYRRNGSTVEARLLMEELKRDPVNVHIAPTSDEMVNVVADVLRSFFRHLDTPLVPYFIQKRLFAIAEIKDANKLDEYHEVLMSLPRVRLQTLRRLLDHLRDVTEHANANLATVENIAKVFGPTLFSVDNAEEESNMQGYGTMINQVNVLKDLILSYTIIFRVSLREMHAKSKMDMLQGKANSAKARADGFLVPIHLFEKDNHTFNVQSSLTAEQVCEAARNRPSFRDEGCTGNFALFEMVKCGQLQRRVGLREKMSSMVTDRWLDWDPTDCFLLFKRDLQPFSFDQIYPFADDVKIAEPGSKSFTTGHLKLETGTTIVQYNKSMKQLNEWHVDDVLWFMDHETGRKPPTSYTLTFVVPKKNFKFKSKFIGYCVAFRDNNLRIRWLNAVLSSQVDFQASPVPLLQI
uniref:Arf-GAP with Rho-GAP domain, ANK repeat and PH domain-containing protein 3 n=1 Tax=Ascaris suum TaxID=6253 RepID=F1KS03_ASCSU